MLLCRAFAGVMRASHGLTLRVISWVGLTSSARRPYMQGEGFLRKRSSTWQPQTVPVGFMPVYDLPFLMACPTDFGLSYIIITYINLFLIRNPLMNVMCVCVCLTSTGYAFEPGLTGSGPMTQRDLESWYEMKIRIRLHFHFPNPRQWMTHCLWGQTNMYAVQETCSMNFLVEIASNLLELKKN